jgi:hypothetical protein
LTIITSALYSSALTTRTGTTTASSTLANTVLATQKIQHGKRKRMAPVWNRYRRQVEETCAGSACDVFLRKLLNDAINSDFNIDIDLQYRVNCSTFVFDQQNVDARLVSYDNDIKTILGNYLLLAL